MSFLEIPLLEPDPAAPFPPTIDALEIPNGLLAWGGDLKPARLLTAYSQGIFPWYSEGQPILWWSPAPRCVIYPPDVYLSRRTRRRYNSGRYRLTADTAFSEVIQACSEPRDFDPGTWITEEMKLAYCELHQIGHAHCVEVWEGDLLAGGIYGLASGTAFFGESMFSIRPDASKIALVALCRQLQAWSFGLLDCQVSNPHLLSMGAVEVSRDTFEQQLRQLTSHERKPGSWTATFTPENRW